MSHLPCWEFIPCFAVSSANVQEPSELEVTVPAQVERPHLFFEVSSQKSRWQNPSESFSGNVTGMDVLHRFFQRAFRRPNCLALTQTCHECLRHRILHNGPLVSWSLTLVYSAISHSLSGSSKLLASRGITSSL